MQPERQMSVIVDRYTQAGAANTFPNRVNTLFYFALTILSQMILVKSVKQIKNTGWTVCHCCQSYDVSSRRI